MKKLALIAAFVLLAPVMASAEDRFAKGSWELGMELDSDGVSPTIGYFFADNLQASVMLDVASLTADSGGTSVDIDTTNVSGQILYHFPTGGMLVPYLGGGFGYEKDKDTAPSPTDTELTFFAAGAGVKLLVGERGSVNLRAVYLNGTLDDNAASVSADVDGFDVNLGYSLYF